MTASEETGNGPVIHDNRRIDPVTGQVRRGRHAASKPAGTAGADPRGRQAADAGSAEPREGGPANSGPAGPQAKGWNQPAGGEPPGSEDEMKVTEPAEEILEGTVEETQASKRRAETEARLAERTADLQRLQAEYANYRKRVDRDRAVVREQAVATTLTGLLPVLDAIDQAREAGELSGGFKSVADSLQSALAKLGLVAYGEKGDRFDPKVHEALSHTYSSDVAEDSCVEILMPGYKVGDRILRPARVAVAEPATGPDGASNEAPWTSDEEGN
jgi:molecular chaperone GrpE